MTKYYCKLTKRNIWELGYFGGGAISFKKFEDIANKFSDEVKVSIESVYIDEIFISRRFKNCKYIFSTEENQKPCKEVTFLDNVFEWLYD